MKERGRQRVSDCEREIERKQVISKTVKDRKKTSRKNVRKRR